MRYVPKILFVVIAVGIGAALAWNERAPGRGDARADAPSRSDWARDVGELCVDVATVGDQRAFVRDLEQVDRPSGDARIDRWVELQDEGRSLASAYDAARRSGDRTHARVAALRLVEFGGRDREAARGLGLPPSCVSAPAGGTLVAEADRTYGQPRLSLTGD